MLIVCDLIYNYVYLHSAKLTPTTSTDSSVSSTRGSWRSKVRCNHDYSQKIRDQKFSDKMQLNQYLLPEISVMPSLGTFSQNQGKEI